MPRGMQPLGIERAVVDRDEERDELVTIFMRDGLIDPAEQRFLDRHDRRTRTLHEIEHCLWTGMAWFRRVTVTGRSRAKELERQYRETFAADAA